MEYHFKTIFVTEKRRVRLKLFTAMCVYKHYKVENRVMSGKESKNAFNWCCHVAHES